MMGIADISEQFKSLVDGKVHLSKVTMQYHDGGSIQRFEFRVSKNRGPTHSIEVECTNAAGISEVIKSAADQAVAWAESQ
jgi:hypothetical protein